MRPLPLLVGLALSLAGCATAPAPLPVPFVAQQPDYCGPAALAMVAAFYGRSVSQEEIARDVFLPHVRGSLTAELASYARRLGLAARQYRGSWEDLRENLAAKRPVIVLAKTGSHYHYMVVLGLNESAGTVTVHSDTRPRLRLSREEFQRRWDGAERWTLLVQPAAR